MATSKLQILVGTALKFNGEAGADVAFSMEGVATGAGWVSAQYNLGASARDWQITWYCELLCQATPTANNTVDFYAVGAPDNDATMVTGDVGQTDAAWTVENTLHNLYHLGAVTIDTADTSKQVAQGVFEWSSRYLSILGWNASGAAINATDSNFIFNVQPYVIQGQAT